MELHRHKLHENLSYLVQNLRGFVFLNILRPIEATIPTHECLPIKTFQIK